MLILLGVLGWARILWMWYFEEHLNFRATFSGHLPSVIFAVLALVIGFQIWLIGLLADLIASSRRLTEDTLYRVKRMELELFALRERGQMIVERLDSGFLGEGHSVDSMPALSPAGAPENGTGTANTNGKALPAEPGEAKPDRVGSGTADRQS